ncbi:MAG TPA: class I SAM-dependent methyltransferase [Mycobacteriales bacterium]|nr:class I SAM-dependent methyltransferase [Mycobacteriales bacterium]
MPEHAYDPEEHYDFITDAWALLLGDDLHYGVFTTGDEPLPVATAALTQEMLDAARVSAGARVLDVGCGTGHAACRLAVEHGADVLGITPSTVGIERATARAAAAGVSDRARFEARDGMDNGLPDASFDRVWVLESSHLMPHRDRLIAECARVLVPGGRVALCDITRQRDIPFLELRGLTREFALLRAAFGNARMEPRAHYEELMTAAGLVVDTSIDLTAPTRPTFARWKENAERHHDRVVAEIGEPALDAFVRSCDVLDAFWGDGTLGYGLVAAHKPA